MPSLVLVLLSLEHLNNYHDLILHFYELNSHYRNVLGLLLYSEDLLNGFYLRVGPSLSFFHRTGLFHGGSGISWDLSFHASDWTY